MPNIDLNVNTGQTKQLTFNCANTYMPEDIVFNITATGDDANTDYVIQCETAAGTRLKSGKSVTQYTPTVGIHLIRIKNTNTYTSNSLYGQFNNVPSNTTTPIYINGSQSSSTNRTLPAGLYAAYYDGTRWRFRTDGKIDFGSTGLLKANGTIDYTAYTTNTGTVTSVSLSNATNGGLTISSSPITSSGSITVGHTNVLTNAQTTQAVYPIKIDKNGHISAYGTAVTIPTNTNQLTNGAGFTTNTGTVTSVKLTNATNGGLTISGSPITSSGNITVGHTNVLSSVQSTQAVYPITIDKNGHIGSYGNAVTIPTISGTNDGTNWTSLTINGTTKNIPSVGSGSVEYLNDLGDVYSDARVDEFLGYNGSIWTGTYVAKTVNAGSGLNTTSGDTTSDGGYIGFGTTLEGNSDASVPTGTLHLTRVNTSMSYNNNVKLSFGPTENKTVTSSSNTFTVPYYKVDKFGRVTDSATRTITINGLGGGSSNVNVSATASEDTTQGYYAGSITINGGSPTNFVVSPARITESGVKSSKQGVVRPQYEIDTTSWADTSCLEIGSRLEFPEYLNVVRLSEGVTEGCFLPITVIYRYNEATSRYESIPGIIINNNLSTPFVDYSFDEKPLIVNK